MDDFNFDQLVQQHEMGRAYKKITEQMGPSPQLVAFVNYENVTEGNVGLESFDIMAQHQVVLNEINDDHLGVALEGFDDVIKKYRLGLVAGGAALLLVSIAHPGIGLGAIGAGIMGIIKNAKAVPTVKDFTAYTKAYNAVETHRKKFATVPVDLDEAKWEKYYDELVASDTEFQGIADAAEKSVTGVNEPFDKSGWSESSFKNAVKWLHDEAEQLDASSKRFASQFESVAVILAAKKDGLGKTPSLVSKSFNFIKSADKDASDILHEIEGLLKKVSKNFETKK